MNSTIFPPIPMDTVKAAQAVFGRSNFYLVTGDQANRLFEGFRLQIGMAQDVRTARNQALRYLITIFQYMESLPDHLVPGALRDRLDWKYALHLSLTYAHLEHLALCEFRQNCLLDRTSLQFFQVLIRRLSASMPVPGNKLDTLQAHQLIGRVCLFSRLGRVWEAFNQALEALAIGQPEWLLDNSLPHWFERYDPVRKNLDLSADEQQQRATAQAIGQDGAYLLKTIANTNLPSLKDLPEIKRLAKIWQEQYYQVEEQIWWRDATCVGCSLTGKNGKLITQ